jgi:hypothetical protein
MVIRLALALCCALALPAAAATQDEVNATLSADPSIWGRLQSAGLAWEIRRQCPDIEARDWAGRFFLLGIYNDARAYGFTRDQIRIFQRDDALKERLRAEVSAYVQSRGARLDDPETLCALGRAEIAAGTEAGELLRAR